MTDATADVAFGLMLAVSRKMFFMHKSIIENKWGPFQPKANLGLELKNMSRLAAQNIIEFWRGGVVRNLVNGR